MRLRLGPVPNIGDIDFHDIGGSLLGTLFFLLMGTSVSMWKQALRKRSDLEAGTAEKTQLSAVSSTTALMSDTGVPAAVYESTAASPVNPDQSERPKTLGPGDHPVALSPSPVTSPGRDRPLSSVNLPASPTPAHTSSPRGVPNSGTFDANHAFLNRGSVTASSVSTTASIGSIGSPLDPEAEWKRKVSLAAVGAASKRVSLAAIAAKRRMQQIKSKELSQKKMK